jgi:hypothetical protein
VDLAIDLHGPPQPPSRAVLNHLVLAHVMMCRVGGQSGLLLGFRQSTL